MGLECRTCAGVQAASGHDVVAFLVSPNALRVSVLLPEMGARMAERLAAVQAGRRGLAVIPLGVGVMAGANPVLEEVHPAPVALVRRAEMQAGIRAALGRLPGAGVVLVGGHAPERVSFNLNQIGGDSRQEPPKTVECCNG